MVGANYMGGKRNAARAKSRDTTRRVQKQFFGKQRIEMLSRGFATSTKAIRAEPTSLKAVGDIAFAHAKSSSKIHTDALQNLQPRIHPPSQTRPPIVSRRRENVHDGNFSSTLLDKLDTSDPIFLRNVLDRVLKLPDLASLSKRRSHSVMASPSALQDECRGLSDSNLPSHYSKRDLSSSPISDFSSDDVTALSPPRPCDWYQQSSRISIPATRQPHSRQVTKPLILSAKPSDASPLRGLPPSSDVNLSDLLQLSDDWGEMQMPTEEDGFAQTALQVDSPTSWNLEGSSEWDAPITPEAYDRRAASTQNYTVVEFSRDNEGETPSFSRVGGLPQEASLHKSVFDFEDPWHVIGVVLGLPDSPAPLDVASIPASNSGLRHGVGYEPAARVNGASKPDKNTGFIAGGGHDLGGSCVSQVVVDEELPVISPVDCYALLPAADILPSDVVDERTALSATCSRTVTAVDSGSRRRDVEQVLKPNVPLNEFCLFSDEELSSDECV